MQISPSSRARCQGTRLRIPQGQIRFVDSAGTDEQYFSTDGMALLLADSGQLRQSLREELAHNIRQLLPPCQRGPVREALSERRAAEIHNQRRPRINPPRMVPWTCNRCGKRYSRSLQHALRHVTEDACSTPRMPPPGRVQSAPDAHAAGHRRLKHWQDTLRYCLKGLPRFAAPASDCHRCATRAKSCDSCFHARWTRAAHDISWIDLIYGKRSRRLDRPQHRL